MNPDTLKRAVEPNCEPGTCEICDERRTQWTTTPPTEPGWYFWRVGPEQEATPTRWLPDDSEYQDWSDRFGVEWWPVELSKLAGIEEPK